MTMREELEALHAQQKEIEAKIAALYRALVEAPAEEKACPDFMAEQLGEPMNSIEYPITVSGITHNPRRLSSADGAPWVPSLRSGRATRISPARRSGRLSGRHCDGRAQRSTRRRACWRWGCRCTTPPSGCRT